MRKIFAEAERQSGLPAMLISAVAYLESGGNANAQSPTGPKGVMQIASGTGRAMGLRMIYATKYRVTSEKRKVKGKRGRMVTKTVKRKTPYTVLTRDERLDPRTGDPGRRRLSVEARVATRRSRLGHLRLSLRRGLRRLHARAHRTGPWHRQALHRAEDVLFGHPGGESRPLPGCEPGDGARLLAHLLLPHHAGPGTVAALSRRSGGVQAPGGRVSL